MAEQFWARPEQLRATAGGFADAGERYGNEGRALRNLVHDLGEFWGDDRPGNEFATRNVHGEAGWDAFLPQLDAVVTLLQQVGNHIVDQSAQIDWQEYQNRIAVGGAPK